jgi:hypothetical protein
VYLHNVIGLEKEWKIDLQASAARNGWIGHCCEDLHNPISRLMIFK